MRWGTPRCFVERDLYTAKLGSFESTEIEQRLFGRVDHDGRHAVEHFSNFDHAVINREAFRNLMRYMSLQKIRTPKGLAHFAELFGFTEKNQILAKMAELQDIFGATWTEASWSIVEATEAETKFILSDHPVTLYNPRCPPGSVQCRGDRDPDIRLNATHTLFPLSMEKVLILTNVSWLRNPYGNPLAYRPNPELSRNTVFSFHQIQAKRMLTNTEVNEINYVIKERARRYIAAAEEAWLYPERVISTAHWNRLGGGYLFMPDPRSATFTVGIKIGYGGGRSDGFDAYGRRPGQPGYQDEAAKDAEQRTFRAFQGEFARVFGPKRRGRSFEFNRLSPEEDTPDAHASYLAQESKYKPPGSRRKSRGRGKR
jgi:hypothetical protein